MTKRIFSLLDFASNFLETYSDAELQICLNFLFRNSVFILKIPKGEFLCYAISKCLTLNKENITIQSLFLNTIQSLFVTVSESQIHLPLFFKLKKIFRNRNLFNNEINFNICTLVDFKWLLNGRNTHLIKQIFWLLLFFFV